MKKTVRILAVVMSVLMLALCLASCGKTLSGKYEGKMSGTGVTFDFKGSKVDIVFSVVGFNADPIEASYKIEDDKISFEFADEEEIDNYVVKLLIEGMETPMDFEETENGIKIGVVEYKKAD